MNIRNPAVISRLNWKWLNSLTKSLMYFYAISQLYIGHHCC